MKQTKGILYALISSGTFGLIPLFTIPIVKSGLGEPSTLFYRFLIAAGAMAVLTRVCGKSFRIDRKQFFTLLLLGILYAATALGLIYSYTMIPSGMATTIHFLYPIVVAMIMMLFFREKKSFRLIGAAAVSLAGVALMSMGEAGTANLRGIMTVLFTVLTYSIYIVAMNKSGIEKMDSMPLTFYMLTAGALFFGVFALGTTGIEAVPSAQSWVNLVLLALIPTVVSDLTLVRAVQFAGSTTTSILGSLEPLTAVLVGVLYFSEPFSSRSLLGLLLVLGSVVLVVLEKTGRHGGLKKRQWAVTE